MNEQAYIEIKESKRLLLEAFNEDTIINAIKYRRILYIKYQADDSSTSGYRTILPCVWGVTLGAGNEAIRAWQLNGASDSFRGVKRPMRPDHDSIPEWRLFRLDRILDVRDTGKNFTLTPQMLAKYNENDSQLTSIKLSILPQDGVKPIVKGDDESVFTKQTDGFKSFYTAPLSQDLAKKDAVIGIFDIVKKLKKKNPNQYNVIYKKNTDQYFAVTDKSTEKYSPDEVLGNLKTLYDEAMGIKPKESPEVVKPEVELPQKPNVVKPDIQPQQEPTTQASDGTEVNITKNQADIDRDNFLKS